jgi:hypothetical protein
MFKIPFRMETGAFVGMAGKIRPTPPSPADFCLSRYEGRDAE